MLKLKKVVIFLVFISMSLEAYEGCAPSKKEALSALNGAISVKVLDKVETKTESKFSAFFESVTQSDKTQSEQKSFAVLNGVEYKKKGNEWCALVTQKNLQLSAKNILAQIKVFSVDDISKEDIQRRASIIEEKLGQIEFVKAVYNGLSTNDLKILQNKVNEMESKVNFGVVSFYSSSPYTSIKISGINKTFKTSQKIILKAGRYSYEASATNAKLCPVVGELELDVMESQKEDIEFLGYPSISFSSNKNDAQAFLDGKKVSLDQNVEIPKCSGTINWSIKYNDQKEEGSYALSPGFHESVSEDFLSSQDKQNVVKIMEKYTKSDEINLNYAYASASNEFWDKTKRIELRYFKNLSTYKYGFGVNLGTQDSWSLENLTEIELTINGRIQIADLFNGKLLHIGNLPLVPFVGASLGVEVNPYLDDNMPDEFYYIFRVEGGSTLLFTKDLGINMNLSYDLSNKEDFIISLGLVFSF